MKLNNIWGYGQLFGYSGLEGPNRYYDDNILMTMKNKLEFRFEFRPHWIKFRFPIDATIKYLMSDFLVAESNKGVIKMTFIDNDTLVGVSPVLPVFEGQNEIEKVNNRGVDIYALDNHFLGFKYKAIDNNLYRFVIHHSFTLTEARSGANYYIGAFDIDELINKCISYYEKMPECLDKKYEALYYKALSVNKVNVHTPEGKIDLMWTTPDRVPHRHMWMWDSVFHAMAMGTYNIDIAKEILLAMLKQTRENGFMPHMANPTDCSDVTQPCVMSFGVYEMYKLSKDKEYVKQCLPYLEKYLTFDMNNRDVNKNGLLEWLTEPEYTECKCGESGLDNSPRFDFDEEMDCIDFSSFFALDTHILSLLYKEVGDSKNSEKWESVSKKVASLINKLMWDDEDGVYYDRLFSGELTKVLTPASFLPMFAGISTKEQAEKMVKVLTDKRLLWSKCPVASISQQDPRFSNDMWRGGVWANLNYFIIEGLKNYGYIELADLLRDKTLDMINKWYQQSGCIFEFFDPKDETHPLFCHRKGDPLPEPDYRKHVHSISDYNWSACFAILLIQRKY
jgi:hypothetical protein